MPIQSLYVQGRSQSTWGLYSGHFSLRLPSGTLTRFNIIAELALSSIWVGESGNGVDIGFTRCLYVDSAGNPHDYQFPDINTYDGITTFSQNGVSEIEYQVRTENVNADLVATFFVVDEAINTLGSLQ